MRTHTQAGSKSSHSCLLCMLSNPLLVGIIIDHWLSHCAAVNLQYMPLRPVQLHACMSFTIKPSGVAVVQEKKARVEKLIQQLALQACRNTTIGSSLDRGVSGGEVSPQQLHAPVHSLPCKLTLHPLAIPSFMIMHGAFIHHSWPFPA